MMPSSRTDFLNSFVYRCALAYNKRNNEKMKAIQEMLETAEETKRNRKPRSKKRYTSAWKLPDVDDKTSKGRNSKEALAIIHADKDECDWIFNEPKNEYTLTIAGYQVMKIPTTMYQRLKPFQRDAVKWIAGVGPIGGILADDSR